MTKRYRPTQAKTLQAINGSAGIVSTVANNLGVEWHTAQRYIEKWESTKQAFMDEQSKAADMAEEKVLSAIKKGDVQTAKWFLARIRKDKFSERQEVAANISGALQVEYVNDWRNQQND